MLSKIILAGFGGQGIIVAGKLLASAAMKLGKNVTHFPSYGAEMRGGTCNCSVVISDKQISSPIINEPDVAIVLNKPSKDKYEPKCKTNGMLILNKSLIKDETKRTDLKVGYIDASEIAERIGNSKVANMVILGAFAKITSLVNINSLIDSLKDVFPTMPDKLLDLNIKALQEGFNLAYVI
ncbi:MAG: 2-oxoacid:ferredoxin oxidoreductase subunit gamma [Spirochaetes bacterium GWC1_27_15]|nr:MAG: 2-oxoacid:ferredoxin oxidoreductase subunit gamma [Spirochaetes bacterium GWB1_27_13]OHD20114.1 MAG: 2-oxoacid:ferredoxin oxidoreductase subunit gamma [Spirochaetes bacterium GWC1_27_15]